MAHVLVRHTIKDYDSWKKVFDSAQEFRRQGGEKSMTIYHVAGNRNEVVAIAEYESLDKARAYFGNADLRAKMEEAGVVGPPEITYIEPY
jgi:hypothetical protein